jgi:hypothetical protein
VRWDSRDGIYLCAYEGCGGDALSDAWRYEDLREGCGWPEVPQKGLTYRSCGQRRLMT